MGVGGVSGEVSSLRKSTLAVVLYIEAAPAVVGVHTADDDDSASYAVRASAPVADAVLQLPTNKEKTKNREGEGSEESEYKKTR